VIDVDRFERNGWVTLPVRVDAATVGAVVESFGSDPDRLGVDGRRLDAWRSHRAVRALAAHPPILAALAELHGRRPIPFQTLNFCVGTEQRMHSDTIHFDSRPSGLMCGVWVALEDIGVDQGPLTYVPGSHLLPAVSAADARDEAGHFDYSRYEDLVAEHVDGLATEEFHARAGDVLVWHASLVHGGAPVRRPDSTRWSQVTHYFFEGGAYVTPMLSDPDGAAYRLREPLIDISTGERVIHRVDGRPARLLHVASGRTTLLAADEPVSATARLASRGRGLWRDARFRLGLLAERLSGVRQRRSG
jgi:hypothetical protein